MKNKLGISESVGKSWDIAQEVSTELLVLRQ